MESVYLEAIYRHMKVKTVIRITKSTYLSSRLSGAVFEEKEAMMPSTLTSTSVSLLYSRSILVSRLEHFSLDETAQ